MALIPLWLTRPEPVHVYRLCLASIIITAAAAISGVAAYITSKSSLMLCFGLENCLDLFSSAVVLWRFYKPGDSEERISLLKKREKRASVAITVIILLLGFMVTIMALVDFTEPNIFVEGQTKKTFLFSGFSFVIFSVLTAMKLKMAKALDSRSLWKDGLCSLIGTILSFALILTTLITMKNDNFWWLDPAIALMCGLVSFVYGIWSVYFQGVKKGIPIWSPQWWISSRDTRDENDTVMEEEMTEVGDEENYKKTLPHPPIDNSDLDSTSDENLDDLTLASIDERN